MSFSDSLPSTAWRTRFCNFVDNILDWNWEFQSKRGRIFEISTVCLFGGLIRITTGEKYILKKCNFQLICISDEAECWTSTSWLCFESRKLSRCELASSSVTAIPDLVATLAWDELWSGMKSGTITRLIVRKNVRSCEHAILTNIMQNRVKILEIYIQEWSSKW